MIKETFLDGRIEIYNGDCLDILPNLSKVRLIIADPPYNNNTEYDVYEDKRDDYRDWCRAWFEMCRKVSERVIITPGHGNLWMWNSIEQPWGVGCWYKPGNPASSVLGWCCWEPWLYYCTDYKALGGPDTIRAPVSTQKDIGGHPCPKPLALMTEIIKKSTKENKTVLDPFMGSGTTAIAAMRMKRKFVGIEISPNYFQNCVQRIKQEINNEIFV